MLEIFYVYNEYGETEFTTTDETEAIIWCEINNGFYCYDEL